MMSAKPGSKLAASIRGSALGRLLFVTRDGRIIVGQAPNPPLYACVGFGLAAAIVRGTAGAWLGTLAALAFAYWALLEIFLGVNLFRRILGSLGAILLVAAILR